MEKTLAEEYTLVKVSKKIHHRIKVQSAILGITMMEYVRRSLEESVTESEKTNGKGNF